VTVYALWFVNEWELKNDLYGLYETNEAAERVAEHEELSDYWVVPTAVES
jgi:hypothetical protein